MDDFLRSGYHKSSLRYDNIDWFVNEVLNLENIIGFYFKNTKKDFIMIEEDEEDFENNNLCQFSEKNIESNKIRDHCHLNRRYRGPAHNKCSINVKQSQSDFLHLFSIILVNMIVTCFFKKLVDKKNE